MLNMCGELNCHSHYTQPVRERFNYSVFAAAFYTSALLQLMRQGVDAEMYWVGTEDQGGYGMMNKHGDPWPSFYAKKLVAQHVRYGDSISFPTGENGNGSVDVVVACGEGGRRSVLVTHQKEEPASYRSVDAGARNHRSANRSADRQRLQRPDRGNAFRREGSL